MNDLITTINTLSMLIAERNSVIAQQSAQIEKMTKRIAELESAVVQPIRDAAE